MFPRYLFVQIAGERERKGCVIRSPGINDLGSILRSPAGNPLVVPERVVTQLRAGCDETGAWHVPQARRAAVGDSVTVQSGTYAGWQGVVSASKAERVAVLLSILGGPAPVWIDRAAVQISG
jgi:transcription antitermination factor NusG